MKKWKARDNCKWISHGKKLFATTGLELGLSRIVFYTEPSQPISDTGAIQWGINQKLDLDLLTYSPGKGLTFLLPVTRICVNFSTVQWYAGS